MTALVNSKNSDELLLRLSQEFLRQFLCYFLSIGEPLWERKMEAREFYVIIERDEDGYYVGEVPQLQGCYSQGETIDELMTNIKEVIELCLEDSENFSEFIGIQKVVI